MDKRLARIPAKKPHMKDNTNDASTSEQENDRADAFPIRSTSFLSAALGGKNNGELIRSVKKSGSKFWNDQHYPKYGFTATIKNAEMCVMPLSSESMKPSVSETF